MNLTKSGCGVACNYRAGLFIRGSNRKNEYTRAVVQVLWRAAQSHGHHGMAVSENVAPEPMIV